MALMEVINALMRNTIDLKRATLILRALHIAVKNARRIRFNAASNMVKEVPEFAVPDTSISEQTEIAHAMNIPPLNSPASKPGYVRTRDEMIRDGVIRPGTEPKESREDLIAHYYGYPNAAAHAAALAAEKAKAEGVNVERVSVKRAPSPANAEATTDAASSQKTPAATANVGTAAPGRPGPQVRREVTASQHDTTRVSKKPSATAKFPTPQNRRKANGASAG
jgi:hypothetical protein